MLKSDKKARDDRFHILLTFLSLFVTVSTCCVICLQRVVNFQHFSTSWCHLFYHIVQHVSNCVQHVCHVFFIVFLIFHFVFANVCHVFHVFLFIFVVCHLCVCVCVFVFDYVVALHPVSFALHVLCCAFLLLCLCYVCVVLGHVSFLLRMLRPKQYEPSSLHLTHCKRCARTPHP
jgi:hypothetical protein